MTNGKYILDGHTPVLCDDLLTWGNWYETHNRHVALDEIGEVKVSTVFLGLDHNFCADGPPLLFETMVFGGLLSGQMERYATWEEAEEGHKLILSEVKMHAKEV